MAIVSFLVSLDPLQFILCTAARMILLKWDVPPLAPNPLKLSHHLKSQISTTAFEVYITWLLLLPSPLPFCLGHLYLHGHLPLFPLCLSGNDGFSYALDPILSYTCGKFVLFPF